MWKLKWISKAVFNRQVYGALSKKVSHPFSFHKQLALKFFNDSPRLVKIQLKSGRVFYAYRFMDLFKLYEIFLKDDYKTDIAKASCVVDVGGNKGYFSLRMSELFPHASFFCYEPEPKNFSNLKRLLEENNVKFNAYQEGVGGESGELKLFIDPKNDGGHSLFRQDYRENISIKIVTLNTVLGRLPSNSAINLLKLDCEGAEKGIILGMTKDQAERIDNIFYEPTYNLYDPEELNTHLSGLGYHVFEENGIFKAVKNNS